MTTKPELNIGPHLIPGVAAVLLFVVMAGTFLTASFPAMQGFPDGANITSSIGYAMFNLDFGSVPSESFLIAFEIIDLVLVAALAGAVLLARRETDGKTVSLLTDGGRELKRTLVGNDADRTDSQDDTETGGDR